MPFELPVPVTAALSGVIVGFFLNWLRDYVKEVLQTKTARKRLAVALLSESLALRDRYKEAFGNYIQTLPVGQPLAALGAGARYQDFFAVYDGSAGELGLFPSSDLRSIVRAYTLAKGHVESISSVKEMLDGLQGQITLLSSAGHAQGQSQAAQLQIVLQASMVDAANRLRTESSKVLSAAEEAIKSLEDYAK